MHQAGSLQRGRGLRQLGFASTHLHRCPRRQRWPAPGSPLLPESAAGGAAGSRRSGRHGAASLLRSAQRVRKADAEPTAMRTMCTQLVRGAPATDAAAASDVGALVACQCGAAALDVAQPIMRQPQIIRSKLKLLGSCWRAATSAQTRGSSSDGSRRPTNALCRHLEAQAAAGGSCGQLATCAAPGTPVSSCKCVDAPLRALSAPLTPGGVHGSEHRKAGR